MAKKTAKGSAKRATKKTSAGRRTKTHAPRKAAAKKASAGKTGPVTAAVHAAASTVTTAMDRLRAWSPTRYSTR